MVPKEFVSSNSIHARQPTLRVRFVEARAVLKPPSEFVLSESGEGPFPQDRFVLSTSVHP